MNDTFFVHFRRRFDLIGFDTSHIMRLFRGQNIHQFIHGIFENGSGRLGSFGGFGDVYGSFGPHGLINRIFGPINQPFEILEKRVPVLVDEPVDVVGHVAGVVFDDEILTDD